MSPCISLAQHQSCVSLGIKNGNLAVVGLDVFLPSLQMLVDLQLCLQPLQSVHLARGAMVSTRQRKNYVFLCFVFSPGFVDARDLFISQL